MNLLRKRPTGFTRDKSDSLHNRFRFQEANLSQKNEIGSAAALLSAPISKYLSSEMVKQITAAERAKYNA